MQTVYMRVLAPALSLYLASVSALFAQTPAWQRQFGSSLIDRGFQVATDSSGNVLVMGNAELPFDDDPLATSPLFIRKLDAWGATLWTRRIEHPDYISAAFATDLDGNSYVASGPDSTMSALDPLGNTLWTETLGPALWSSGVSARTPGAIYTTGYTFTNVAAPNAGAGDAVITKVGTDGTLLWQRQFGGSRHDETTGISSDAAGNVYVSGFTTGDLDGPSAGGVDAFVSKYDTGGNALWTRQLGAAGRDVFNGVATDAAGNVYLAGSTDLALGGADHLGARDAVLTKYDSEGNFEWIRQFGTGTHDDAHDVAVDSLGNIYVVGETQGALGGPSAGLLDLVISKFDPEGNVLWNYQVGTNVSEVGLDIDVDPFGNVVYTGWTLGDFASPNVGTYDAIVGKLAVPEPTMASLAGLGLLVTGLLWRRWH